MTRSSRRSPCSTDSDGMVADGSVRVALQQAIDSARNLANGTNLKENDVTAAVDALNAAKDAVQQAMDQYQEASSTPNTVTNNTNIGTNGGAGVGINGGNRESFGWCCRRLAYRWPACRWRG